MSGTYIIGRSRHYLRGDDRQKDWGEKPEEPSVQEGSLDLAELLLSAGAKVDAKTKIGDYTPLHVATAR